MKASEVTKCVRENFYGYTDLDMVWIEEFRPSMGWSGERSRLDLWGIRLSPSNGMHAHAFEVKVSRSDWLAELKQPLKRRMALAISNYFWIAAPTGIVKPEELPHQTGLLEVNPEAISKSEILKSRHPADYRDKVRPTWAFVASALRNYKKGFPK